jgi:hypothetical protein
MKKILLVLIFTLITSSIFSQAVSKKNDNKTKTKVNKVLIVITTGFNDDNYYEANLVVNDIQTRLYNSDTTKKLIFDYTTNKPNVYVGIKTKNKESDYESMKGLRKAYDANKFNLSSLLNMLDTIVYYVNFDLLSERQKEAEELKKDEEEYYKAIDILNRYSTLYEDGVSYYKEYSAKCEGKSDNKIADMLYNEGFSRTFDASGSVIKSIYTLSYLYDNNTKGKGKDNLTIRVSTWYSYGYGSLYYSVDFDIYLADYGTVVFYGRDMGTIDILIEKYKGLKEKLNK